MKKEFETMIVKCKRCGYLEDLKIRDTFIDGLCMSCMKMNALEVLNFTLENKGIMAKEEMAKWVEDYVDQKEALIKSVLIELLERLEFERVIMDADDLIEKLNKDK